MSGLIISLCKDVQCTHHVWYKISPLLSVQYIRIFKYEVFGNFLFCSVPKEEELPESNVYVLEGREAKLTISLKEARQGYWVTKPKRYYTGIFWGLTPWKQYIREPWVRVWPLVPSLKSWTHFNYLWVMNNIEAN